MNNAAISYYENLNTVAANISIVQLIDSIETGKINGKNFANRIYEIRNEQNKDNVSQLKKKLPKVTISGIFDQKRITENFISHSGLLQIDIDELPNEYESFAALRILLEKDKYTFCCFFSPSEKIKLLVKIPPVKETHLFSFLALEEYYNSTYKVAIDKATKDIARLCFLSHDPSIFVNNNADVYTNMVYTPEKTPKPIPVPIRNVQTPIQNSKAADVENCINQIERNSIDITGTYQDWLKLGFAISDEFGESGRDYFQRISKFSAKYDYAATDKQYTNCLKNTGSQKIHIASFFQACKDYGIDTKSPSIHEKQYQKENIASVPNNIVISGDTAEIDDIKSPIKDKCENRSEFISAHDFYYENSCYYIRTISKSHTYYNRISNFIMQFLYFFPDGTNNARWYIKIQSNTGEMAQLEITAKDLNSISSFKPAIMSKGRFSFSGNQAQLDKIIEYHNTEYQKAHKITCLGWQSEYNIYAYSNGIIDHEYKFIPANKMGIVISDNNNYYLPALSELTKEDTSFVNEKRFVYKHGKLSFADYNRLIIEAYGVNGAIGNAYLIASIFRDIVFAERSSFPYLFLFGEAGTGKTTFTDLHLSLFGNPQPGIGISNDSTSKSIARRISQFKNALTYIKEYTNNDVDSSTIGLLKTGYEGVGYDRAQTSNDNKTHQTGVLSGIFIDGNELPEKNSALFSRTITITFERSEFTPEQATAKNILKDEAEKGLGQIFVEIARHRQIIAKEFGSVYRKVMQYLKSERAKELGLADRTIEHIALLIAPVRILEAHLKFNINIDVMIDVLISAANAQNEAMRETNEVYAFFQTIAYLSSCFKIKDGFDYHIKPDATGAEVLSLAFENVYPLYVEQCVKQRTIYVGKASLKAILKNKPFTKKSNQKGSEFTPVDKELKKRVWRFDYKSLNIEMQRNAVYGT